MTTGSNNKSCQNPKCWKDETSGACRYPDHMWEHVKRNIGLMTEAELKESVPAKGARTMRELCRMVRNRGGTTQRDLSKIPDICDWASQRENQPHAFVNFSFFRDRIVTLMVKQKGAKLNLNKEDITPKLLNSFIVLIDANYFINQSLYKLLNTKNNTLLMVVDEEAGSGRIRGGCISVFDKTDRNKLTQVIRIKRPNIFRVWDRMRFDGFKPRSKLEVILLVLCHELTHAVLIASCSQDKDDATRTRLERDSVGHGVHFADIGFMLWGVDRKKHSVKQDSVYVNIEAGNAKLVFELFWKDSVAWRQRNRMVKLERIETQKKDKRKREDDDKREVKKKKATQTTRLKADPFASTVGD